MKAPLRVPTSTRTLLIPCSFATKMPRISPFCQCHLRIASETHYPSTMPRGNSTPKRRSGCPLNASVEMLGDRWSLLILRDMMLRGFSSFKEFLTSYEGIATNILSDRLKRLIAHGIIATREDASDGRKLLYILTPNGLDL